MLRFKLFVLFSVTILLFSIIANEEANASPAPCFLSMLMEKPKKPTEKPDPKKEKKKEKKKPGLEKFLEMLFGM